MSWPISKHAIFISGILFLMGLIVYMFVQCAQRDKVDALMVSASDDNEQISIDITPPSRQSFTQTFTPSESQSTASDDNLEDLDAGYMSD